MSVKKKRTAKTWSYSVGEKGVNRVRVFDRGARGLYAEYYDRDANGAQKVRLALGTTDREAAKATADELALTFRKGARAKTPEQTLGSLFEIYEREVSRTKGASIRAHDERAAELFTQFFGIELLAHSLSAIEWRRFITARRSGAINARGAPVAHNDRKPVANRALEYDLQFLLAVLNFALVARDSRGNPLLDRNPLRGLKMPREENPKRPMLTEVQYVALREAARSVHPLFALALVLAHETGHRISSVRQLRWSDIDCDGARIQWRAESDKIGFAHSTPITTGAIEVLREHSATGQANGNSWVFPSPRDPQIPCSRHLMRDWWERGAKLAGLPARERLAWHSLRRQFASDLKKTNLKDLCALGGWKSPDTVVKCYIQPDEATQRAALLSRQLPASAVAA